MTSGHPGPESSKGVSSFRGFTPGMAGLGTGSFDLPFDRTHHWFNFLMEGGLCEKL